MQRIFQNLSFTVLLVTIMIIGCVSTSIQLDWKDPGFSGTFKKVLVICMAKEMVVRTTLESDMATQFTNRGVAAVQSHTLWSSLKDVDREMIKRKLREIGADGVFLIRPVGQEKYYADYTNIYDQTMPEFYIDPLTLETYRVQVSLFEATKGKVVWQAISETIIGGAWTDTLKEFARVMGNKLIEHGLI